MERSAIRGRAFPAFRFAPCGLQTSQRSAARPEDAEHEAEHALLLPARRRGAADIVEDLAVLDAVIGQPLDPAAAVEIDRDDAAVDFLLRQERGLLGPLRDVIEDLARDG